MQRNIEKAEEVILKLVEQEKRSHRNKIITNTKLRNILGMVSTLFIQLTKEERSLEEEEQLLVDRFTVQLVYESGREDTVKTFVREADLINRTKEIKTTTDLRNLYHYIEALVAYHKYYVREGR